MVQLAKNSALVGGTVPSTNVAKTITIMAVRGFNYRGSPVTAGTVIDAPAHIARELIAMAKAVKAVQDNKPTAVAQVDPESDASRRRGLPPKQAEGQT